MKTDDQFDAYLSQQLNATPLPDHGFTSALVTRVERQQRGRYLALTGVGAATTAFVGIAWVLSPTSAELALTPGTIVATLLLATLCGLAWIGTEANL